jgi:hypothetical protein
MKAQWVDGDGKILLSDNTGSGTVAHRPIRFQCVGFWTSAELHIMFNHTYTRFLLVLDMLERKYWVWLCLYVRLWPIIYTNPAVKLTWMKRNLPGCHAVPQSQFPKFRRIIMSSSVRYYKSSIFRNVTNYDPNDTA